MKLFRVWESETKFHYAAGTKRSVYLANMDNGNIIQQVAEPFVVVPRSPNDTEVGEEN